MVEKLRAGVIGCGFFAQNHLNAWRDLEDVELVAVCDRDEARAKRAAEKFGVQSVFTGAEAMLQSAGLDFVDIATTAETHRPLVELAARYQTHTICQKPFAPSMQDARAMVKACQQAGVRLMVHENFRWQTPMRRVKARLDDIGEVFYGRIYWRSAFDVFANQPYLAEDERFIIYDLGIHLLDLARYFMGEVERLTCLTRRVNPNIKGEDVATFLLKMQSGAACVVEISFASRRETETFPQTLVTLEGSNGSVDLQYDYQMTVVRGSEVTHERAAPAVYAWSTPPLEVVQESVLAIQRHWVECLRANREPDTSGADNLKTLELVFGGYESAASGLPYVVGAAGVG
jgi:predicted dehydrogenase